MTYEKTLAAFAVGLSLACATLAQAQTRWDLPGAYSSATFHTQLLQQFAHDVATRTEGKLVITVHDNASLYKAPEIKRAVQGGQVQLGEIVISNFANEDPLFGVDGLPFLTSDYDSAWRLYQAQKPWLEDKFAQQGMLLLYTVPWPPQGIYTHRELHTVADMRGLKMRAYNPATARIAELVGAQAVTIQAAEEMQRFGVTPKIALLSHSNFGSRVSDSSAKMARARELVAQRAPELEVDGEMHADAALSPAIRAQSYPDSTLTGPANLLIMPNLDTGNITYNLLKTTGSNGVAMGPVLLGAARPVHILTTSATIRRIVNMTALAVVDAQQQAQ